MRSVVTPLVLIAALWSTVGCGRTKSEADSNVKGQVLAPHAPILIYGDADENQVVALNLKTKTQIATIDTDGSDIEELAISSNGSLLAAALTHFDSGPQIQLLEIAIPADTKRGTP